MSLKRRRFRRFVEKKSERLLLSLLRGVTRRRTYVEKRWLDFLSGAKWSCLLTPVKSVRDDEISASGLSMRARELVDKNSWKLIPARRGQQVRSSTRAHRWSSERRINTCEIIQAARGIHDFNFNGSLRESEIGFSRRENFKAHRLSLFFARTRWNFLIFGT